ncbi:hypothetical protein R3P38DRAFT_3507220, partial [Favolaschia claudopus]
MQQRTLDYAINHLFLPPKLPQQDDSDNGTVLREFLEHISHCAQLFVNGLERDDVDSDIQNRWRLIQRMLCNFADLHRIGGLSKNTLQSAVCEMQVDDVLCFHVQAQNAGIILRRATEEILVEYFQASPPPALVAGTKGKLVIQYPCCPRLSIPIDQAYIQELMGLLADLDVISMPDAVQTTVKAGKKQTEIRGVPDIRYISELFGGIVRSLTPTDRAEVIGASTVYVTKRINDHVLWKSALLPWRRSPKWLILRVALETTLAGWKLPEIYGYKMFITFILSETLKLAKTKTVDVNNETRFLMNSKIAIRMWKLQVTEVSNFPVDTISQVINCVGEDLHQHWEMVQAQEASEASWVFPTFAEIERAKQFSLSHSLSFLETVRKRSQALNKQSASFNIKQFEKKLKAASAPQTEYTPGTYTSDLCFLLTDMEKHVSSSLEIGSLSELSDWIEEFNNMALSFAEENPEVFSRIFLIVLELWVALDQSTISQFPLLADYCPNLSLAAFEPLLLPKLCQMQRLRNVELYLERRFQNVHYPHLSVFSHNIDPDSLPSRYCNSNLSMQALRSAIEAEAVQMRQQKVEELKRMSAEHSALVEEIEMSEHLYITRVDKWGFESQDHASSCTRCTKEKQAHRMKIQLFEWPLPEHDTANHQVVFELQVPEPFGIWRESTYQLAKSHSTAVAKEHSDPPVIVLENYTLLKKYFVPYRKQHITLASTAKSFVQSHYRERGFPCGYNDVIENHPLRYRQWEKSADEWLPSTFPVIDIRLSCTLSLPLGSYQSLKWTFIATTHTSNQVIAKQSQCPSQLSYHEWISFGHLRAGANLQWHNMTLQLITGEIDLASPAVHLLFCQAAWQAEMTLDHPSLGQYREAHFDLSQELFGQHLVRILHQRLQSISGNWKEGWTATTLATIACRLLSLTPNKSVKDQLLVFLVQLREQLFIWMKQLLSKLNTYSGQESSELVQHKLELIHRVLQLAASCRQTYNVDIHHLRDIFLDHSTLSIFIQCAIVLNTNTPPNISSLSSTLRYLLNRDITLAAEALNLLLESILHSPASLDHAIASIWHGYLRDSTPWCMIGQRWVRCQTSVASLDAQARVVHLDLLSGSFLVDGQTQGTLPKEIINHPFFKTLFPNRYHWDIVPSTMTGMNYQSRDNIEGFQVHFKLDGTNLLVRTRDGSLSVSEFIPSQQFEEDIPANLVLNNIHIFHEQTQSLDIYPVDNGWQPGLQASWHLDIATRVMNDAHNSSIYMLDPVSPIVIQLASRFQPLEDCRHHLTVSINSSRLSIKLPRYDLEFYAISGGLHLESKDLPGFYVSPVQSVGTLIGLKNKLILNSVSGEMPKIFVPSGKVTITLHKPTGHPQASISPLVQPDGHINFFSYEVDDLIGRIVCTDGSSESWYQLAYLHTVTTSHFADPLLHCTGICQAQEMLKSAQAFAFMEFKPHYRNTLQQIIDLVPVRKYYPHHLTTMETVEWRSNLPVLIQCSQFIPLVKAILDYAEQQALFQTFQSQQPVASTIYKGDLNLWERANYRISRYFYNAQLDGFDVVTSPIRCLKDPESVTEEHIVAQVATLVRLWPKHVKFSTGFQLWSHLNCWRTFSTKASSSIFDSNHLPLEGTPSKIYFQLLHLCHTLTEHKLLITLSILSYRDDFGLDLILSLLALATNPERSAALVRQMPLDMFDLSIGHEMTLNEVLKVVKQNCHPINPGLCGIERQYHETAKAWKKRKANTFSTQQEQQCNSVSNIIFDHWPAHGAILPTISSSRIRNILPDSLSRTHPIIKLSELRKAIEKLLTAKLRNRGLFEYILGLQHHLHTTCGNGLSTTGLINKLSPFGFTPAVPPPKYSPITLGSLLSKRSPLVNITLRQVISDLKSMSISGPKIQYIDGLSSCITALEGEVSEASNTIPSQVLELDYEFHSIPLVLCAQTISEQWLGLTGQWPSFGPQSLLRKLSLEQRNMLSDSWKLALCRYAEDLAIWQQHQRITVQRGLGLAEESLKEVEAVGGQEWDANVYPDWLLVQLDADLHIRPVQAVIAQQMISPASGQNALMQLNMGEGKSSVIVPIISSALADGQQLVRVIVLKPLAAQMFQLLKQRITNLVNRRLFYFPFNRDIDLDAAKIQQIFSLFKQCAQTGGILLCQPEHILSFQLMGLHAFSKSESKQETYRLREAQNWLNSTARDILDESDEILNVRYQLIYTIGTSTAPDGRPWRWQITQAVFTLLETVAKHRPEGLEIGATTQPCQFPIIRIITLIGTNNLLGSLIQEIVFEDRLQEWISFQNYSTKEKEIVLEFLQKINISTVNAQILQDKSGEHFAQLLLLRGLFAHGILNLSLHQKRWRVDYGLDPSRTMLAVPYRAKDSPALRAEFGHPDMIIVLTCLSYYYGGLTDEQLDTSFRLLLGSDNPETQYEYWIHCIIDLPPSLANLRGLNLDDFEQKTHNIFPYLRHNKAVIDFYLAECVFPKEAREFPHKLTTNAWDLAQTRPRLTTGFSGTNDNKYLLPLSIKQCDQESQHHTNALVLRHILRPENREVICTESEDAMGLLRLVIGQDPHVQVLLDVGAQVLELQNGEVAEQWLKLDVNPNIEAAIYFNSTTDEIRVLSRDGRNQPFASSLYKNQLGKTLLYLDEAHTRGTDFKLPGATRAVVTLGPRLTKDKLVQGCMRMRRLGKDHSLLFFAPREICDKITTATGAQPDRINSEHVLLWTMKETCEQIKENGSLWANQGTNFDQRHTAMREYDQSLRSYSSAVDVLRERESRTLEELYGLTETKDSGVKPSSELEHQIREKCKELGITPSTSALSEEQERELAHEKEDEREVERIPDAKPCQHLDRDLEYFVQTGTISQSSKLVSLADCLRHTSWIHLLPQGETFRGSNGLRATRDFCDTIALEWKTSTDNYLRPAQWLMSTSKSPNVLILVSPSEANKWLPEIRRSEVVYLHLYSPRTSRKTFWPMDKLNSFTVPVERSVPVNPQLLHELNLFAGQLFCADRRSMDELCGILGLHLQPVSGDEELQGKVDSTGFVRDNKARTTLGLSACSFGSSPLPFFRDLVGARRKGQGFTLTHMGQILRGIDPRDPTFEEEQ